MSAVAVTNGVGGVTGTVAETVKGTPGMLPVGATATVPPFGAAGIFNDFGFQVTFGGTLGLVNTSQLALTNVSGFTGYVGETAKGGAGRQQGLDRSRRPATTRPTVTTAAQYTIPTRTPFALTGSATDFDGESLTYMWEQTDRGGAAGTALVNNTKTNGPLFRQFGTARQVSPSGHAPTPSPGLNAVSDRPDARVPGPARRSWPTTRTPSRGRARRHRRRRRRCRLRRDCFSEFLPTNAWVGFRERPTLNFG